jgi:hypothetical protein
VVDGVLRGRAPARWRRLQRGSGERERRRECGECERASGMKRGGRCSIFIEVGEERGAGEEEMVAGVMAFMERGIKGRKNNSI